MATVSRALNEKGDVSAPTRRKVRAAAATLGYVPDAAARALVSHRTQRVGVVIGDSTGHRDLSVMFFGLVMAEISRRLADAGYEALLLNPVESSASPLDHVLGHRVDAVVLIGIDEADVVIRDLVAASIPCVGVDVRCDWVGSAWVGSDHVEGTRLGIRHLHALGHRRIAHIAGAANTVAGAERLAAFRKEVVGLGLELPPEYIRQGDFSSASGYREACALLALPNAPTAVAVASDLMALAALQAVWDCGLEPGRDVAVLGFDDLEAASLSHPPLTTIRQDRRALGALAAARVLELLEGSAPPPPLTLLPVELVVRASTAAL
jgi:LacI family transcriptional regulator